MQVGIINIAACVHFIAFSRYCSFPTPASDRDLILHFWLKQDEATKTSWLISINGDHSNAPTKSKVVHTESKLSGVIIKQDEKDPNSLIFNTNYCLTDRHERDDPWLHCCNGAFVKSSDDWREALVNFYHKTCVKERQ